MIKGNCSGMSATRQAQDRFRPKGEIPKAYVSLWGFLGLWPRNDRGVHFNLWYSLVLPLLFLSLVGCNEGALQRLPPTSKVAQVKLAMAPTSDLPGYAQEAEPRVRDAYRFAVANPEVMTKIPCYCGCGAMGHEHALHCFVKDIAPSGYIEFDNHAAGCGICVDITQDVMKMMRQGEELKAIRAYVDAQYSQFAAPTNTPPIE